MRTLVSLAFVLGIIGAVAACEEDFKACYEGDYVSCSCGGRSVGYARCNAREAYDACVCDGSTPGVDAGQDASVVMP